MIEFERADAVEDIMTEGQRPSYWTHGAARVCYAKGWEREHEGGQCLSTVDEELFILLAALVCLHLV